MLKYIGSAFVPGVPARDLSAEEVEEFGGIEYLLKTGCYIEMEEKQEKKKYSNKLLHPDVEEKEI